MPADLPPPHVAEIASYGRQTMWVDGGTVRLYRAGKTTDLELAPMKALDLGPGPDGRTIAVYQRCKARCDVYRYDLARRREVRWVRDGRAPTVYGRRLVFVRGQHVLLRDGTRTRTLFTSVPAELELGAKQLAYTGYVDSDVGNGAFVLILHGLDSGRERTLDRGTIGEGDSTGINGVTFMADGVYWQRAHRSACTVKPVGYRRYAPRAGVVSTTARPPLAVRRAPLSAPDTPESEACNEQ